LKIQRKELFITTKLWFTDVSDPEKQLDISLGKLKTDYVDLYLVHWPINFDKEVWRKMESLLDKGKCKAIGVSNFNVKYLKELLSYCRIKPMVNQVEFSLFLY